MACGLLGHSVGGVKMKVGNQFQVCVKLDQDSQTKLDLLAGHLKEPKNRVINQAIVRMYSQIVWKSFNHG